MTEQLPALASSYSVSMVTASPQVSMVLREGAEVKGKDGSPGGRQSRVPLLSSQAPAGQGVPPESLAAGRGEAQGPGHALVRNRSQEL